jgi:hypothetical protein
MNFNSSGRIKTSVLAKMARLNASVLREDGRIERMCNHGIGHTVGNAADTPRGE